MEAWIVELDNQICRDVQQEVRSQFTGWVLSPNRALELTVDNVIQSGIVELVSIDMKSHLPGLEVFGIKYWLTNALPIEPDEIDYLRERYRALQDGTILASVLDRKGSGRIEVQDDPQTRTIPRLRS